jgi:hypothetical protein
MLVICMIVMVLCLGCEGAILFFSGFPFLGAQVHIDAIGIVWVGGCISIFAFAKRPISPTIAGWALFLTSAILQWFYSNEEKSVVWFLYQHSLELIFVAAAHVAYFLARIKCPLAKRQAQ